MRIDLRLEGPDFRFGQQVFLFLQFLGLVDRFEDVADAVKDSVPVLVKVSPLDLAAKMEPTTLPLYLTGRVMR